MADCINCKYAVLDYEEYYNTNATQWFVEGCKKDMLDAECCPEFEEWEEDDGKLGFAMMDAENADQALALVDDAPTVLEAEEGE